jgi:hypothetical protein
VCDNLTTMKKYDREKREWITEEEYNRRYHKREGCKGGRDHQFVLVVPQYHRIDGSLGMDIAERFYEAQDVFYSKQDEAQKEYDERLASLGLKPNNRFMRWGTVDRRQYICLECKKQKWM